MNYVLRDTKKEKIIPSRGIAIDLSKNMIFKVALVGLLAGIFVVLLAWFIDFSISKSAFCEDSARSLCLSPEKYSTNVSIIIVSFITILSLQRIGVMRPIGIGLASAIALWGVSGLIAGPKLIASLVTIALFFLTYLVFFWLSRLRRPPLAFGLIFLVAIAIRIIIDL